MKDITMMYPPASLSIALADRIVPLLTRAMLEGEPIKAPTLYAIADQSYKGTMTNGTYNRMDVWDALQLAMNTKATTLIEAALQIKATPADIYRELDRLGSVVPTQTVRTQEQMDFQQFSTPPAYAFVAAWLADLNPMNQEILLEPSAGTGSLIAVAAPFGLSKIFANEMERRRLGLLREGFSDINLSAFDATYLHAFMPRLLPTVVLMNPPFSSNGATGIEDTMIGAQHVEQALRMLEPGGRLVAILSGGRTSSLTGGMHFFGNGKVRAWWERIRGTYTVRLNAGISGQEYKKFGTTISTRLVVIDKCGPTTEQPVSLEVERAGELFLHDQIHRVRRLRGVGEHQESIPLHILTSPSSDEPSPEEVAMAQEYLDVDVLLSEPANDSGELDWLDELLGITPEKPKKLTPEELYPLPEEPEVERKTIEEIEDEVYRYPLMPTEALPAEPTPEEDLVEQIQQQDPEGLIRIEDQDINDQATDMDDLFQGYKPYLRVEGSVKHPAQLVESDAMRAVKPLVPKVRVRLPKEAVNAGRISDAQIETVAFAIHCHDQILRDEKTRKAFLIGDGTGVGKGTEQAAIAMHYKLTMDKPIRVLWVTKEFSLADAVRRDWAWVNGDVDDVFTQDKCKGAIERDGILVTTYKTMTIDQTNGGAKPGISRLQQIINWNPDLILFDESHLMGNAMKVKGARGMKKPSQQAMTGLKLMQELPDARIVFVSATAATEVINLVYAAHRLGLCGKGTPFEDEAAFVGAIQSGGMLAMEIVAKDMKAMGVYTARNLSFDGTSFEMLVHNLTDNQKEMYNDATTAWRTVIHSINECMELTGADGNSDAVKHIKGQYWGACQRFFNQILISMQTPTAITHMRQTLAEGNAVVIQLVNTNEAATERAIANAMEEDRNLDDLDITPRDTLIKLVDTCFPIYQYEKYTDDQGNVRSKVVVHPETKEPLASPLALEMKEDLMLAIAAMNVPQGALDMLIDSFGVGNISEITGRTARYVLDEDGHRIREARSKSKCDYESARFMNDECQVLVFSGAGNTGRSWQADLRCKNQRRRYHYVLQPGWRADEAIQGMGRTHRTNQKSAPHYILVSTNLEGQKRFVTSIARRIEQLGSLTKGNRKATSGGLFSPEDNLETPYAHQSIVNFFYGLKRAAESMLGKDGIVQSGPFAGLGFVEVAEGMGLNLIDEESGNISDGKLPPITQFLNRLLVLDTSLQGTVYHCYHQLHRGLVEDAIASGNLDTGIRKLRAKSIIKVHEQVVYTDESGATTRVVQLKVSEDLYVNDWASMMEHRTADPYLISSYRDLDEDDFIGYVQNRKSNGVYVMYKSGSRTDDSTGDVHEMVRLCNPKGNHREERAKVGHDAYTWIDAEEAEPLWNAEYEAAPRIRYRKLYLVTGALLPVWDRISCGDDLDVMVVETDQGERMIGQVLGERSLGKVLKNLGVVASGESFTTHQLIDEVMSGRSALFLSNNWEVRRVRAAGEYRMHLIGPDIKNARNYSTEGIKYEWSGGKPIFYIPAEPSLFEKITRYREVVTVLRQGTAISVLKDNLEEVAIKPVEKVADWVDFSEMVELVDWAAPVAKVTTPATPSRKARPSRSKPKPVAKPAEPVIDLFNQPEYTQGFLF